MFPLLAENEIHIIPWHIEFPKAFLAVIIGFVLLVLIAVKFIVPMFRNGLNARSERIADAHAQVERALSDTRHVRDDYAARLQRIETESIERINAAVREAEAARTEIIAEAQQSALAVRRRAEEEISRERTRQRILFRQQLVQITLDAAEQSARTETNDTVHRQLIGDFITRAADGSGGASAPAPVSTQGGA